MWQTPVHPLQSTVQDGLGVAAPVPGKVFAVSRRTPPWVRGFDHATGAPLDASELPAGRPGEGGIPPYTVESATAMAAGFGGMLLAGSREDCRFEPVPPPGFIVCSRSAWLGRYAATPTPSWRVASAGSVAVVVAAGGGCVLGSPAVVECFDLDGRSRWVWRLPPTAGALLNGIAPFPAGGVVVAGGSDAGPLLQRVDASGVASWPGALVPGFGATTRFERIAVDSAGSVHAAGTRPTGTDRIRDIVVAKFDANGALLWSRTRPGVVPARAPTTSDGVGALTLDAQGNLIVTATASSSVDFVAWTAKYDAAGTLLWSDEFATDAPAGSRGLRLAVDGRGQIYAGGAGHGDTFVARDGFVRKLAPDGVPLWAVRWSGSFDDVIVGGAGDVLVLGGKASGATLMRLDPGAAQSAPTPTLQLTLPPGPVVPGTPVMLVATIRGAVAPTGVATFRVNGAEVCAVVVLEPATAMTSTARCDLPEGLPPGLAAIEVRYGGDANNGAASAAAELVVGADGAVDIPALSPVGLALLAVSLAAAAWRYRRS